MCGLHVDCEKSAECILKTSKVCSFIPRDQKNSSRQRQAWTATKAISLENKPDHNDNYVGLSANARSLTKQSKRSSWTN